MESLMRYIDKAFESSRNGEKASQMKAYMKDQFDFYGIQSPMRREILRAAWKKYRLKDLRECYRFVKLAWNKDEREWQYLALDVLNKFQNHFDIETVDFAEQLILKKSWWDTVDGLASNVVGKCFSKFPELRETYIKKWMDSDNMWLQRTCLIFQLKYKENTDWEMMQQLILELQNKKEFFIRKASGWALRQYSKTNPKVVKSFIDKNPQFPSLVIKEGSKYING